MRPRVVGRRRRGSPTHRWGRPGGLESAADAIQAGTDLRARNDALRRAFDAVPGGPEPRAQIEALVESSRRPSPRATDFVEERSRDLENRAIASTLPMGEEAYDLFKRERELDEQDAMQRELLREQEQPGFVAASRTRPALRSYGSEPVGDFEAYASFLEEERREQNAVDAVNRGRGAATGRGVADRLDEQSALDAALRREMLADPGGADVVREMDARAAEVEAAQQREMLADPGGLGVLRSREAVEEAPRSLSLPDRDAALLREMLADPGGAELVRGIQETLDKEDLPPVTAYRTITYDLGAPGPRWPRWTGREGL